MNSFKTKVELDMHGLNIEGNYDVSTQNVEILWNLELEMRNWGVKGFDVAVPEQKITVFINKWGDDQDEEVEMTFDLKDVEIFRESEGSSCLYPSSLQYNSGEWTLVF